jgi:hypothetical protein
MLNNNTQIDVRIIKVTRAIMKVIKDSTSWVILSKQAKDFWLRECAKMMKRTRTLFYEKLRIRMRSSKQRHKEARMKKVQVIRKHRQKQFHK